MRELKILLFIYLIALVSVTILPMFNIFGAVPNLILTMAIIYMFNNEIKKGLLWAICGSLFLDLLSIWSTYNTLIATVIILSIYFLIKKFFESSNIYIFLIFCLFGNLVYNLLLSMWQSQSLTHCYRCSTNLILGGAIYSTLVGLTIYAIRKRL